MQGNMTAAAAMPAGSSSYIQFLTSIHGRITRKQYWLHYFVPYLVVSMVLGVLDAILGSMDLPAVLSLLFMILMIWPSIAVGIKRCHDRGRSGWFLLVGLIPIIGGLWLLVELGFLRGTVGDNRFGPDPLMGQI